ncbi:MAG: diguanylate cyclase/phosphodiesterase with PAS/PAC sensor(s) [uncultured bacterium]|nr:MAG: diguanylate cyclase/phosphodiesterase with PAS/PAC sensor(s) [uncultured bacterium]
MQTNLDKFKSVFEDAGDGIIAVDIKTQKFTFANPMMCQITGYSLEELLKLGVVDIHPIKKLSYVKKQVQLQTSGKISLAENIPVLRKDGSIFFCDINAKVTKIGNRKYLVGFFRDITRRLDLETLLNTRNKQIMALSQVNQTLVYATNEKDLLRDICHVLVNFGE